MCHERRHDTATNHSLYGRSKGSIEGTIEASPEVDTTVTARGHHSRHLTPRLSCGARTHLRTRPGPPARRQLQPVVRLPRDVLRLFEYAAQHRLVVPDGLHLVSTAQQARNKVPKEKQQCQGAERPQQNPSKPGNNERAVQHHGDKNQARTQNIEPVKAKEDCKRSEPARPDRRQRR